MKEVYYIMFSLLLFSCAKSVSQTVYITKENKEKEYHEKYCSLLEDKYNKAIEKDLAIFLEYKRCKICISNTNTYQIPDSVKLITPDNPKHKKQKSYKKKSSSRSNTSVRCSGKTKSGRRCKRKTKSTSGRCYQH